MTGTPLFVYAVSLLVSFVVSLLSVACMMRVFKIDLSPSAIDQNGMKRSENLRYFIIFGTLAPIGSAFATVLTFVDNHGPSLFTVLSGVLTILLGLAVTYMAVHIIEAPAVKSIDELREHQKQGSSSLKLA